MGSIRTTKALYSTKIRNYLQIHPRYGSHIRTTPMYKSSRARQAQGHTHDRFPASRSFSMPKGSNVVFFGCDLFLAEGF